MKLLLLALGLALALELARGVSTAASNASVRMAVSDATPSPAGVASPAAAGIAYDEIARVMKGDATPPPPGNFDADAAAFAALPPLPMYKPPGGMGFLLSSGALGLIPIFGGWIAESLALAKIKGQQADSSKQKEEYASGMAARAKTGVLASFAFYHGWSRVALTPEYTIIDKPDQNTSMTLDNQAKMYQVVRTGADIETYTVRSGSQTVGELEKAATVEPLPSATIAGRRARGYRTSGSITIRQGTFFCSPGEHRIVETEYVSDIADPRYDPSGDMVNAQALVTACTSSSSVSHQDPGRLVVYRVVTIDEGAPTALAVALERGNIRSIGERDAALFLPPPDFKVTK